MDRRSWRSRISYAVGAALGAVAASIALPTAMITTHAIVRREAQEISDFALTVAEPFGLIGAALATYVIARLAARRVDGRDLIPWIGGAAAAGMIAAALWVFDADLWTAAAAIVLPVMALLAGRRARIPTREVAAPSPAAGLPSPPPDLRPVGGDREDVKSVPGGRNLF